MEASTSLNGRGDNETPEREMHLPETLSEEKSVTGTMEREIVALTAEVKDLKAELEEKEHYCEFLALLIVEKEQELERLAAAPSEYNSPRTSFRFSDLSRASSASLGSAADAREDEAGSVASQGRCSFSREEPVTWSSFKASRAQGSVQNDSLYNHPRCHVLDSCVAVVLSTIVQVLEAGTDGFFSPALMLPTALHSLVSTICSLIGQDLLRRVKQSNAAFAFQRI